MYVRRRRRRRNVSEVVRVNYEERDKKGGYEDEEGRKEGRPE